jgi:hypothetical protein
MKKFFVRALLALVAIILSGRHFSFMENRKKSL